MRHLWLVAAVAAMSLSLAADETREQKEKRLADAIAEMLELTAQDQTGMTDAQIKQRDKRGQELEQTVDALLEELAGKDRKAQDALFEEVLKKHRPDAVARLEAEKAASRETDCKSQLKQIAILLSKYRSQQRGWPDSLEKLKLQDEKQLVCPLHGEKFTYLPPPKGDDTPEDQIVLWCAKAHSTGNRVIGTFSGRVMSMRESVFQAAQKSGRLGSVEPRVTGLAAEFVKKNGKTFLKVCGKIENLVDPTVSNLPFAQATAFLRTFREVEGQAVRKMSQSPTKKLEAPPGKCEVAFEIELETGDSAAGLDASIEIMDLGSLLTVYRGVEIPGAGKK